MPKLRQPREQAPKASVRFESTEEPKRDEAAFEQEEEVEAEEPDRKAEVEAAEELKKQIEALRRSEQTQRERAEKAERDRVAALEAAKAKDAEIEKTRNEVVLSRASEIDSSIAAQTEIADAAEREYASALQDGDTVAAAKANRKLTAALTDISRLRAGKAAIEAEIEEAKNKPKSEAPAQQQQTLDQFIDNLPHPSSAKQWLREHPEYLTDDLKSAEINFMHRKALKEGHAAYSKEYYDFLETGLGLRKAHKVEETEEEDDSRSSVVSAPVSREVPSGDGTRKSGLIRLSPAEREAAKMAGITEAEYAKQKQRLAAEKDSGNYGERR